MRRLTLRDGTMSGWDQSQRKPKTYEGNQLARTPKESLTVSLQSMSASVKSEPRTNSLGAQNVETIINKVVFDLNSPFYKDIIINSSLEKIKILKIVVYDGIIDLQ